MNRERVSLEIDQALVGARDELPNEHQKFVADSWGADISSESNRDDAARVLFDTWEDDPELEVVFRSPKKGGASLPVGKILGVTVCSGRAAVRFGIRCSSAIVPWLAKGTRATGRAGKSLSIGAGSQTDQGLKAFAKDDTTLLWILRGVVVAVLIIFAWVVLRIVL